MSTSVKQLMEAANAVVPKITPAQAQEMIAKGKALVLDVRDAPELEKGGLPGLYITRVACWNSAPTPSRLSSIRISPRKIYHRLSGFRWPRCACRQGAQGYGLRSSVQPRRIQGFGRERRCD